MPKATAKPFTDEELIGLLVLRLTAQAEGQAASFVVMHADLADFRKRFRIKRFGRDLKSNVFTVLEVVPTCL